MNQRALSQIGTPILIEDAMLYDELLKDNTALRETNDNLLAALRKIQRTSVEAFVLQDGRLRPVFQWLATIAIQEVEGC